MAQENNTPLYKMTNLEFLQNLGEIVSSALERVFIPVKLPVGSDYKQKTADLKSDVMNMIEDLKKDTRGFGRYGSILENLKEGKYAVFNVRYKGSYEGTGRAYDFVVTTGMRLGQDKNGLRAFLVPVDRERGIEQNPLWKELDEREQETLKEYGIVGTPDMKSPGELAAVYMYDAEMNTIFKSKGEDIAFTLGVFKNKYFGQELTDVQQKTLQHLGVAKVGENRFIVFSARDGRLMEVTNEKLLAKLRNGEAVSLTPNCSFVRQESSRQAEEQVKSSRPSRSSASAQESVEQEQTQTRGRRR